MRQIRIVLTGLPSLTAELLGRVLERETSFVVTRAEPAELPQLVRGRDVEGVIGRWATPAEEERRARALIALLPDLVLVALPGGEENYRVHTRAGVERLPAELDPERILQILTQSQDRPPAHPNPKP